MTKLPELPKRYELKCLIGEGATGHVYQAWDRVLDTQAAVKVARKNLAIHSRFRARFAREVALSAQVVHPRAVPVHDYGILESGQPFVAMAYANRRTMAELLDDPPPLEESVRLVDQILDGLSALHSFNFVHQDLKPANVLLHGPQSEPPDVWVTDLGEAAALSALAMDHGDVSGTLPWMAPEQLAGQSSELGPWTDLYAVGLLLLRLVGGRAVDDKAGRKGLLDLRLQWPPRIPEMVPRGLGEIVRNLLHPDPRRRYDRAVDVRRALSRAVPEILGDRLSAGVHASRAQSPLPEGFEFINLPQRRKKAPDSEVPAWNRVAPDPMPQVPPRQRDLRAPARTSLSLMRVLDPPILGRDAARDALWEYARQVVETGEPRAVLVIGDWGVGRNRFVHSIARALDEGGWMETIPLRYYDPPDPEEGYRGAVREVLAPWRETRDELESRLTRWLARDFQVTPRQVANEAAVLARWCGYIEHDETPVNSAVGLAWLYRLLEARSWRGGTCLVLEDAHLAQAEGDGLQIVEALLDRTVGERAVLALVSLSAEELARNEALSAKVRSLVARGALRMELGRLEDRQMRLFLRDGLRMSPQLADELCGRVLGSPVFATMLLRDWATRELIQLTPGLAFELDPRYNLADVLPADCHELCVRRLEGGLSRVEYPDAAREVLAAVALAGEAAPVSVIRPINPEGLDSLLASGLVLQKGWKVTFEHPGLHQAALELARARGDRAELHTRLADAWEALGKRTGADVNFPMGKHRLEAWDSERATIPLLRAARTALGEGRAALALDAAQRASEAADRTGASMAMVEARCLIAEANLDMERDEAASEILDEAQRSGHMDRNSRARIHVLQARVAMRQGQTERARMLLQSAEATFTATRDKKGLRDFEDGYAQLCRVEGRFKEAARHYVDMLKDARGDRKREINALLGLVEMRVEASDFRGLDKHLQRLHMLARASGDTRNIARATYADGLVRLRVRDLDQAEQRFRTARALAATLGADVLNLRCLNNLGEVYRHRGDFESAEDAYTQTARFCEDRGWDDRASVVRLNLALLAMQAGHHDRARHQVEHADRLLQGHPSHWSWMFVGLARALWGAMDGDERACRAWWAVANERGLKRLKVPDLRIPLLQLAKAAAANGWADISLRAEEMADGLPE